MVRGQGGEGKTALAAELARWMVRSHQVRRAVFVSVETHGNAAAVLDAIGRQLVGRTTPSPRSTRSKGHPEPVERALREQPTLVVVDNMESVLLPPYLEETPEALSEDARARAGGDPRAVRTAAEREGDTRLVFTSREALPAPFDAERHGASCISSTARTR